MRAANLVPIVPIVAIAHEHHSPDPAAPVIRDVERAVGTLGHANWSMPSIRRKRLARSGESVSERLGTARRTPVTAKRDELDLKALVRQRCPVESAVERDEHAAAELL